MSKTHCTALVTFVVGYAILLMAITLHDAIAYGQPCPSGNCPPAKQTMRWEKVESPFRLTPSELKMMQELDRILGKLEQLRTRIRTPRLILPGPMGELEQAGPLSIREYERAFRETVKSLIPRRSAPVTYRFMSGGWTATSRPLCPINQKPKETEP